MAGSLYKDIEELAEEHRMLPTETIRELLRRCMQTRKYIIDKVEKDAECLMGIQSAIDLWGDQGDLYEFLLNMTYDEMVERLEVMWKELKEADEKEKDNSDD